MPGRIYEATWRRVFARVYDTAFVLAERSGLREVRAGLVGQAKGRVVEIGAGTGLNLEHYSGETSHLVLTEPDPHMAAKLRHRASALPLDTTVLEAPAERLPLDDASADTVVSPLVLCTVKDRGAALADIARVRPGGTLLFAEHVRSTSARPHDGRTGSTRRGAGTRAVVSATVTPSRPSRLAPSGSVISGTTACAGSARCSGRWSSVQRRQPEPVADR